MKKIKFIKNNLKKFFKDKFKISKYKKYIIKSFKFSKKNFNIITYEQLFYIFKIIDLNDINIIIYIINNLNIKVTDDFPRELISFYEFNICNFKSSFFKKKKLNDKKKYIRIEKFLKNISFLISKNIFLLKKIFDEKSKNHKKIIHKIDKINFNIKSPKLFSFKKIKNYSSFKSNKGIKSLIKKIYSKNYTSLKNIFLPLKFFFKKFSKKKIKNKILLKKLKSIKINFKINLNSIDYIYKKVYSILNKINKIKMEIFDSITNLSNLNYVEFIFYFFKYGSNLKWIFNVIKIKNYNKNFYKNFKKILKNKSLKLKKIEKYYSTSLKKINKIFIYIKLNKLKIDIFRNNIIKSKIHLIKRISRRYYEENYYKEINHECNISIIKSINNYNHNVNIKFDNYIIKNLKNSINEYIYNKFKLISIPKHISIVIKKINKLTKVYNNKYFCDPPIDYMSKILNLKKSKIYEIINLNKNNISLESFNDEDKEYSYNEILKNNNNFDFDEKIFDESLKNNIEESLINLNSRSFNILNMRFGMNFSRRYTLEEIGDIYSLSKERIRQIQNIVLKGFENYKYNDRLGNFFKNTEKYYNVKGL